MAASPVTSHGDDALQEYLDLLLKPESSKPYAEPTRALRMPLPPLAPTAPVVAAPVVEPVARVAEPVPVAETVIAPSLQPAVTTEPMPSVSAVETADTEQIQSTDSFQPAPWSDNGRPQWAQQRFEVLLFSVGGLNLAVPLVELGAIHALEGRELTPIFGQIDWFLGLLPLKEGALRVIDTAKVVMPERYDDAMPGAYRYVITLSGSDWGLGVDVIHDSVQLLPEAVRWRGSRGKRPWLAGTVVEQMCALIDAAQLTWMFHNLDRRRGGTKGSGATARL